MPLTFSSSIKLLKFSNILFFSTVFFLFSRGLIQLLLGKQIAYFLQVLVLTGFYLYLFTSSRLIKRSTFSLAISIFLLFLVSCGLSAIFTIIFSNFHESAIYLSVTLFISLNMVLGSIFRIEYFRKINIGIVLGTMIFLLVFIAFAQQYGNTFTNLPGFTEVFDGKVRPPSLTGSYLHYPLVLPVLSFIVLQIFFIEKSYFLLASALSGFLGTFLSYSRSGMMIIIGTLLCFILISVFRRESYVSKNLSKFIGIVIVTFFVSLILFYLKPDLLVRLLSALDLNSSGNDARVSVWSKGISLWADSPIIFGAYTGLITNSSSNFGVDQATIVESGLLQQLLNFGLLGTLLYYFFPVLIFFNIRSHHIWLRSCLVACVFQTFVYQSIEVLPYMVIVSFMPHISYAFNPYNGYQFSVAQQKRVSSDSTTEKSGEHRPQ